jgi:hypothetical protein
LGEKTPRFNKLQVLDKFIGEKHHLYKEITRNKCGNCEKKRVSGKLHAWKKEPKFSKLLRIKA